MPSALEQRHIVRDLNEIRAYSERLIANQRRKLDALSELKQAILRKAFAGELTANLDKASARGR